MRQSKTSERHENLVTVLNPNSNISEVYRMIRTNLDFMSLDEPIKSMVITSTMPGEGKTVTGANLAIVNAQAGRKTIIVDADLRKPMMHRVFQTSNLKGLTTTLLKQHTLEETIYHTKVENLDVLTSGPIPPNPAEVVGSKAMKDLIAHLTESYDLVIVDTPPVMSVVDARVLGQSVDGLLFVVSANQVSRAALKKAKEQLDLVGIRVIGAVLNKKKVSKREGYYYYNYHYGYGESK